MIANIFFPTWTLMRKFSSKTGCIFRLGTYLSPGHLIGHLRYLSLTLFNFFKPYSGWAFLGLLKDGWEVCVDKKDCPFPKICHTYSTEMKLGTNIPYLKKTQKIYGSRDAPLELCWHQHFSSEINKFCCIRKYKHRLHFGT